MRLDLNPEPTDPWVGLLRVTPVVCLMTSIGALVAALTFLTETYKPELAAWLGVFLVVSLARIVHSWRGLRAATVSPRNQRAWALLALLHGALWGVLGPLAGDWGNAWSESILHVILAAVAMGAAVHLSSHYRLLAAMVVLVLGPTLLRDLWFGGPYLTVLAFLLGFVGVYTLLVGRNQSRLLADLHAEQRRNAELIEALRREADAKARLFAAANHDLRQPLHALGLLAESLHSGAPGQDVPAVARQMGECVDSLGSLVDALLELARLDAGAIQPRPEALALDALLHGLTQTYAPLAAEKGLSLTHDTTALWVQADRALLGRVLHNLVANAVRYTERDGVHLRVAQLGARVAVAVEDSGIGIAPEQLGAIFETFYQADNPARQRGQGLGIGLATVKRLDTLLGLDLQVHSQPGQGSRFVVHLPLAETGVAVQAAPTGRLHGLRLWVIEDDHTSRSALASLLRGWGCEVLALADAQVAWAEADGGAPPAQAVIADLRLPGRHNGHEAIQGLRARWGAALPALLVTGDVGSALANAAVEAGLPLLRKPAEPMKLRAFLNGVAAKT